jgi:antirestriction protein ArdC
MQKIEMPRKMPRKDRYQLLKTSQSQILENLITDPVELGRFVKGWKNGFTTYTLRNYLLAESQRPGFTLLAGFKTWDKKGRKVKAGEKAIWIIMPQTYKTRKSNGEEEKSLYFTAGPVFDISQTEGEEIDIGQNKLVTGEISFQYVADNIAELPLIMQAEGLANGSTDGKAYYIAPRKNEASMVATLIHEVAHNALGHIGNKEIPYNVGEMEAELVSFMVCSALGIDNNRSKGYISHWLKESKVEDIRAEEVFKVAEKILNQLPGEDLPAAGHAVENILVEV